MRSIRCSCGSFTVASGNRRAEPRELGYYVIVVAVDMLDYGDLGLAFADYSGAYQRSPRPQVGVCDGSAGQLFDTFYDRCASRHADQSAHTVQLIHIAESALVDCLH